MYYTREDPELYCWSEDAPDSQEMKISFVINKDMQQIITWIFKWLMATAADTRVPKKQNNSPLNPIAKQEYGWFCKSPDYIQR